MSGYDSELEYLDARGLVAWIRSEVGNAPELIGDPLQRLINRWKDEGGLVSLSVADKTLNRLDLTLAFVPDHLWRLGDGSNRQGRRLTIEDAREIKISTGRLSEVARRYGCSTAQVSKIRAGVSWASA